MDKVFLGRVARAVIFQLEPAGRAWCRGWMVVLLLAVTGLASAQPLLNADALVRDVLERHPGQQALAQASVAAQARIGAAGAWPDAMLSWAVAPQTVADERFGTRENWQFSQPIPWPGKRAAQRDVAEAASAVQALDLASLQLQVAQDARVLFGRWYWVHQALAINAANQDVLGELRDVATQRYASGQGTQQAVLQAELRRASLRRESLSLSQAKLSARAAINALLDRPVDTPLAPPQAWAEPSDLPSLARLLSAAQSHQPALQALDARESQYEHAVALAKRESFPDLRLNLSHMGTLDPPEKRFQAGISVNLPFNFSRRRSQVQAAEADVQSVRWAQRDLAGQIAAAVADAYAQVEQSRQTIDLYRAELLPLATQNLAAARADWRSGAGDFQAVIDAEQQLLDTQLGAERAKVEEWSARAVLARQVADPSLNLFAESQP